MSKLSFIIPVYKPEIKVFQKALKSLVEQSLKDWEAIFVLDGADSEAESDIERAFKKRSNYKIVTIEHGGAQRARNHGFTLTQSPYVVFFDCDCVIEPHTAKAWVDYLDKNPQYGFVYSGYKFLGEMGAINSEPFDPWTLRVRNYISSCFPLRREFVPKWNEELLSLQDWDFWLSVVEKGAIGKMLHGYAFSTAYPTPQSISGKGCTPDVWLERMDKVKTIHNIPIREVCLTSLHHKLDAIALAKSMDFDYQDYPNDKTNHYKTIVQIGFSVQPNEFERCVENWGKQHKKVIFWTAEDVETIYDTVSKRALDAYSERINSIATQYVEDKATKKIMESSGFKVGILPLPVISNGTVAPLPKEPKFLVDITPNYGHVFNAIQRSIPDIGLEIADGVQNIEDYTGLVCFHQDRMQRQGVKRMLVSGRKVISNIESPFTGHIDDRTTDAKFIKSFVNAIRNAANSPSDPSAIDWYCDNRSLAKVKEAIA